ncbi:hypothetical protein I2486_21540 [Cellulophaga sp. E16_2]|uniref:hypothetical protein n=1 Tax=unclassified Cellulophaga TaxID=2634405 RepID=UPI0013FD7CBC|nr:MULTISPECIES: hypothetical protein [unclassified Cellulophaga]MBO0593992.1 hypothetical protein [Cellulophaga sp. E16_2]
MYKASFDNELLNDWCDFCEGKKEFDKFHFSTLLMETLLEGYTPEFDEFISKITKYFDISIFENIKYAFSDEKKSQGNVKDWVINDLREKRKIIELAPDSTKLKEIIDSPQFLFVKDRDELYKARETDNNTILYEEVGDFVIENIDNDKQLFALKEVLYNIASDSELVNALLSRLIKSDVDLSNYLDIYKNGCDYAVDDEKILIYEFKQNS